MRISPRSALIFSPSIFLFIICPQVQHFLLLCEKNANLSKKDAPKPTCSALQSFAGEQHKIFLLHQNSRVGSVRWNGPYNVFPESKLCFSLFFVDKTSSHPQLRRPQDSKWRGGSYMTRWGACSSYHFYPLYTRLLQSPALESKIRVLRLVFHSMTLAYYSASGDSSFE